jgi:hypothetical protein
MFLLLVGGLFLLFQSTALAQHCQIYGHVLRGSASGAALEGIMVLKTPVEYLGMDTLYTDANGAFEFRQLPGYQTYTIQVSLPPGYFSINAFPGYTAQLGDSGQFSISKRLDTSTLTVFVAGGCISAENNFLMAAFADTATYRSFTPEDITPRLNGRLEKPVKRGKGLPNGSNLVWEVVTFGGFAPGSSQSDAAGGMRVGLPFMVQTAPDKWKPDPVLSKEYCWARVTKWDFKSEMGKNFADIQTSLEDRSGAHTGAPRGLDSSFTRGIPKRPMFGEKKKLPPLKQNNKFFADLVALKVAIASSEMQQTPYGFGDLVYDENNSLRGLSILEIAARADSAITFWSWGTWDIPLLDQVIEKINGSFQGGFTAADTLSFIDGDKLVLKGTAPLYRSAFLFLPGNPPKRVPSKVRPKISMDALPGDFSLSQNYPNPFNPTTTIGFELGGPGFVTLRVFNTIGQQVMTPLDHEQMEGGTQEVSINAAALASGIYFYRLSVEDPVTGVLQFQSLKKMVLLK